MRLDHGHEYRAAVHLSAMESLFSGALKSTLESIGFVDVQVFDDASDVPDEFGDLIKVANANHWVEGVYEGETAEDHPVPSQVLVIRDYGVATTTTTPPLKAPGGGYTRPAKPGSGAVPLPSPGQPDPACDAGYARMTKDGPCFPVAPIVPSGGAPKPAPVQKPGWSTGQKVALATVGLGVALGVGVVVVVTLQRRGGKKKRAA